MKIKLYDASITCELNLDGFDKDEVKYPELANNNLHIWELGNLFSQVASLQGSTIRTKYKLLVPQKIVDVFADKDIPAAGRPTSDISGINKADIIMALNGPMAHAIQ